MSTTDGHVFGAGCKPGGQLLQQANSLRYSWHTLHTALTVFALRLRTKCNSDLDGAVPTVRVCNAVQANTICAQTTYKGGLQCCYQVPPSGPASCITLSR